MKGHKQIVFKSRGEVDICQKWAAATKLPVNMDVDKDIL
jgi:hypothetical protein